MEPRSPIPVRQTPHLPLPQTLRSSEQERIARAATKPDEKHMLKQGDEDSILCRNCGNRITGIDAMIAMNGEHRHTFTNPAGFTFRIGCFSAAPGCSFAGEPTMHHTWFEGFTWQVASCSRCALHLGWMYRAKEITFFGLILDHLVERTRTH